MAERRPFANMVEVLLLAALTERGGGTVASPTGGSLATPPRSVSPADVAATVTGVKLGGDVGSVASRNGCRADVAFGTKCKLCGKVH